MRRSARTDSNHAQIVSALRKMGFSVLSLAAVGRGCPDLCVARRGKHHLLEIKDGDKCPSARVLTPDQVLFHANWKATIPIITSEDDLIAWEKTI